MKIRKVLLVSPPIRYNPPIKAKSSVAPLGLAYLAAVLRDLYEVKIVDAVAEGYYQERKVNGGFVDYGLSDLQIKEKVISYGPQVVGITCLYSTQFPAVLRICRIAKEIDPEMTTVVGGSHPTFLAREFMSEGRIDYLVLGEGEDSFRELLEKLSRGEDVAGIDGLAYRAGEEIKINSKTKFIENLDTLPFPARELLPMEKYFSIEYPMNITPLKKRNTPIITSRGCPHRCAFCASSRYWGHRVRLRSPENVLDEMVVLKEKFGVEEIQFEDDHLTCDRKRAERIFQGMIDRNLRLKWCTPNGIALWTLDEKLLALMKESGCYELTMGIESGSQEVLDKIIHKPLKVAKAPGLVETMNRLGIRPCAFFIIGFPGETRQQVSETIKMIREVDFDRYMLFIFSLTPGSEFFEKFKAQGQFPGKTYYEHMLYTWTDQQFSEMSPKELEKLIIWQLWHTPLKLLFRSPLRFYRRYRRRIFIKIRHAIMRWMCRMRERLGSL